MIFLDANFIISLSLKKHDNHNRATKLWEKNKNKDKITSKLFVTEVLNVCKYKIKREY